jgi:hypothetical protein
MRENMIKLRIDVDYPYPSRAKSFISIILKNNMGRDYLKNSKVIAKMVNESPVETTAFWFFTPKTIPDNELLTLLNGNKHEVSLHVVNDPKRELEQLEKATRRKIRYYTIHGTARLFARIMWKRWKTKSPIIPKDFPLQLFHQLSSFPLDRACYDAKSIQQTVKTAEDCIRDGKVIEIHPEWLFNRGIINRRGPFYETLKSILRVDKELETLKIRKKGFARISNDYAEYMKDIVPSKSFIEKLSDRGIDIFTFIERKWCYTLPTSSSSWSKTKDNIALLQVPTYDQWWQNVGKKTRNMVRKAEKNGVKTQVVEPSEKLAEGIWKIYNETPVRQERAFPYYGVSLQVAKELMMINAKRSTFIGAFFQEELAGFIQLIHGDKIAVISQILALQQHSDKAVNNALIAKAAEVCAAKQVGWVMYGRMGNHPSLDTFKQSNGFTKFPLTRYYVPITKKGRLAVKMGLHRELKDTLPETLKYRLIPLYNWVSRNKTRIKLRSAT